MSESTDKGNFFFFKSPLGPLLVAEKDGYLVRIDFTERSNTRISSSLTECFKEAETPILTEARRQLEEYFQGKRTAFNLPYQLKGTFFQKQAWETLLKIGYGEIWSYSKQASSMGRPKAVRAVGQANGRNPLTIVIPCHRVTGKNGSLTGYGSGLDRKQQLLDLEEKFNPGQRRWS